MMPNAPSSPLWSLTDHAPPAATAASEAPAEPRVDAINPLMEAPDLAQAASQSHAPSAEMPAPQDDGPHEARKGWWQRRFKM